MCALMALMREAARSSFAISNLAALLWAAAWLIAGGLSAAQAAGPVGAGPNNAAGPDAQQKALIDDGRHLFTRDWTKRDQMAVDGDGLGPVFNGTSCVQCHAQGGIGGAGPLEANVQVLSGTGVWKPAELEHVHRGLLNHAHVVLHKFGTESNYKKWHDSRLKIASASHGPPEAAPREATIAEINARDGLERQAQALFMIQSSGLQLHSGGSALIAAPAPGLGRSAASDARKPSHPAHEKHGVTISDRSTPALFGAGLIDQIPDALIEQAARDELFNSPQTAGRVSRLADKQIGRFGWHGQKATLRDFTLTACAVELGLEVSGHPQAADPRQAGRREPPGLDLSEELCDALVAYVAQLPRPIETSDPKPAIVKQGREVFTKIGCADCHRPDLGGVTGLYSDLLLHDMGADLRGGDYGAFAFGGEPKARGKKAAEARLRLIDFTAARQDDVLWRTPPLWGVASSAPYLHDGRATTLSDAIRLHGGQGQQAADAFTRLADEDEQALLTFLGTLVAPPTADRLPHPISWGNAMPTQKRQIRGLAGGTF